MGRHSNNFHPGWDNTPPRGVKRNRSDYSPRNNSNYHYSPPDGRHHKRQRRFPDVQQARRFFLQDQDEDPGSLLLIESDDRSNLNKGRIMLMLDGVLSDPRYDRDGKRINFHVNVNYSKKWQAYVTLPFLTTAELFDELGHEDECEPYTVEILWRGRIDPYLVQSLRQLPYKPAEEIIAHEKNVAELQDRLSLISISFGVWTNDNIFSSELIVDNGVGMSIWCDWERRAVWVEKKALLPYDPRPNLQSVMINVRDISTAFADGQSSLFFQMHCPPLFQLYEPTQAFDPRRAVAFDKSHKPSAAFTSQAMVIRFPDPETCQTFIQRANRHMPSWKVPITRAFAIESLNLYQPHHMDLITQWYKTLPISVALQCEQALRNTPLTPPELLILKSCIDIQLRAHLGERVTGKALQNLIVGLAQHDLVKSGPRRESLMTLFTRAAKDAQRQIAVETASLDPDLALCYQLYLTPTAQILEGPYPDKSNRVLRLYPGFHHHFLRVTFTDEGGESRRIRKPWGANFDHNQFVQVHVGGFLKQGFSFAGREWKWLAYSQSALKESQMLYMCSFNSPDGTFVTPQMIRNQLGIFDKVINQPAKYGARMAQAFSATNASIQIESKYVERIPDIECGSYCFTDGAGELSEDMAADIWHALTKRRGRTAPPSAFQARYGGCKGVWTVNHELAGKVLRIRPSQEKFASSSITFDVAATSKRPGVTYLNRPLIKLLEDLGVAPQTFLDIQRKAVQGLEVALTGYSLAGNMLGENNLASSFRGAALFTNLYEMLDIDFNSSPKDNIDFFKRAAMVGITHCLRDIKFRARILVEGPTLIGVCDVWNILKEGEIYVNQDNFKRKGRTALQGKVLVTRSPVIHPGDVQFAQAIGPVDPASPLFHLVNVVVFSARGSRPLPSMLGGGDLDGDLFNVITNEDLFPTKIMEAGSYDAVDPDKLTRPSEMDDVADFVVKYILNDAVGQISTRHLTIADQSPEGSLDPRCYQLAQFASDAVDFVKSGVPVNTEKLPKADSKSFKPDFLAAAHDQQYPSKKVLGQMFRSVPIQEYELPRQSDRDNVDAIVLLKILKQLEERFPTIGLRAPKPERAETNWKPHMAAFCADCEKIAFRNSLARDDEHKLREEELFVSTSGTAAKLEHWEMERLHRAKVQMGEVVRALRKKIKDLKDDDEDEEEDDDSPDEDLEERKPIVAELDATIKQEAMVNEKEEMEVDEENKEYSEDEVARKLMLVKKEEEEIIDLTGDSDGWDSEGDLVELKRPPWQILAIQRAHEACYYAFDQLATDESDRAKPPAPYGTRLFFLVALETLLFLIKRRPLLSRTTPAP